MFPFWEPVIAPVLEAAGARRVVEVGALRGDTTRRIVERLGPEGVLHVVDPIPGFDPRDFERDLPGRYVFHQGLSLDVLPTLPSMDAALLDGDHNWYTVLHELRALDAAATAADAPLPVLVLHDVGWPYGRRDLYYDPETVPPEHRQPHRRAGMRPGRSQLLPEGQGMSQGLWNAEVEGGPRNGVMTGLEDFLAETTRHVRSVVLPLYFGLAVVVERGRLERSPALVAELDRIESAEGRRHLIEMGEQIRLRAVAHHHTVARRTRDGHRSLAARYLGGVARELGWAGSPEAEWRAALDATLDDEVDGAVVVVTSGDPTPAVLARAHAEAHAEGTAAPICVLVAPPGEAAIVEASLQKRLRQVDLPLDVDVDPVPVADDAPGPDLESIALMHVGAIEPRAAEAALAALRPRMAPGCVVVGPDVT